MPKNLYPSILWMLVDPRLRISKHNTVPASARARSFELKPWYSSVLLFYSPFWLALSINLKWVEGWIVMPKDSPPQKSVMPVVRARYPRLIVLVCWCAAALMLLCPVETNPWREKHLVTDSDNSEKNKYQVVWDYIIYSCRVWSNLKKRALLEFWRRGLWSLIFKSYVSITSPSTSWTK